MDAIAQGLVARLRKNPNDTEALAELRHYHERRGDFASLANLIEGWARQSQDPKSSAQAFFEAAEIVGARLQDGARMHALYDNALRRDPTHRDAFGRLHQIFSEQQDWQALSELLEKLAAAQAHFGVRKEDVALLYHELGQLWQHQLERPDRGVTFYRRAFETDPSLVASIYAAREIYRAAGEMEFATQLCELEAKAEKDPARKIALYRELAHTRRSEMGDIDGCIRALKRGLRVMADNAPLLCELAQMHLERAASADALVADTDRRKASDLLTQAAQHSAKGEDAVLLEQALDAVPDNDAALQLLEAMARERAEPHRLPARWIAFLSARPNGPEADRRRMALAEAYLEAGQHAYAMTCLEWLLEAKHAGAAARLVELYRDMNREAEMIDALAVAIDPLAGDDKVPGLRQILELAPRHHRWPAAAHAAVALLKLKNDDQEALSVLTEASRYTGEYAPLRDAEWTASRSASLAPEARIAKLKIVADLSETRLNDHESAVSAWRSVVAIDRNLVEGHDHLIRLLEAANQWNELADALASGVDASRDPVRTGELLRRLAELNTEKRNNLHAAANAWVQFRELFPEDISARDQLKDILLQTERFEEVLPLMQEEVSEAEGPARVGLLEEVARIHEEHLADPEGAFESWARILEEAPNHWGALEAMEAIDIRQENYVRLLSTLAYRLEITLLQDRLPVLMRMAELAEEKLQDLSKTADYLLKAYDLSNERDALLDRLCTAFNEAGRHRDLVMNLRDRCVQSEDPNERANLYRRIARTLSTYVGNEEGAAEAYTRVLESGEEQEALRYLRDFSVRQDRPEDHESYLQRLIAIMEDSSEIADLCIERAHVLSHRLDRPDEAIAMLERVVHDIQPDHLVALNELARLAEQIGAYKTMSRALRQQLEHLSAPELRLPVAQRLADLHEQEQPDVSKAIQALYAWVELEPQNPVPRHRLDPLLNESERWPELIELLDTLATFQDEERATLLRRAAALSFEKVHDAESAWIRLAELTRLANPDAEHELRELAKAANKGEALAKLYVELAQVQPDAENQRSQWIQASEAYEHFAAQPDNALEALLRAFALDLQASDIQAEVDRLASLTQAWDRLESVYQTLIKQAPTPEEKSALLVRLAQIIDDEANDVATALNHTLRACALNPSDDAVLALAEERAMRAERPADLLVTYDKRRQAASNEDGQVEALLRATELSARTLQDRERTLQYLAAAASLATTSTRLAEDIESKARSLDGDAHTELRLAVVSNYRRLAETMSKNLEGAASLLLRAANLTRAELNEPKLVIDILERATTITPTDMLLDMLTDDARSQGALERLDGHLDRLVDDALDGDTASRLLRRRGSLLDAEGKTDESAKVWAQLSSVAPDDAAAQERLRQTLRDAGKFQELLVALGRQRKRASDDATKLKLLRETAHVWQHDLKNQWEADEAWRKVLQLSPTDDEAQRAVSDLTQELTGSVSTDEVLGLGRSSELETFASDDREDAKASVSTSPPPVIVTGELEALTTSSADEAMPPLPVVETAEPIAVETTPSTNLEALGLESASVALSADDATPPESPVPEMDESIRLSMSEAQPLATGELEGLITPESQSQISERTDAAIDIAALEKAAAESAASEQHAGPRDLKLGNMTPLIEVHPEEGHLDDGMRLSLSEAEPLVTGELDELLSVDDAEEATPPAPPSGLDAPAIKTTPATQLDSTGTPISGPAELVSEAPVSGESDSTPPAVHISDDSDATVFDDQIRQTLQAALAAPSEALAPPKTNAPPLADSTEKISVASVEAHLSELNEETDAPSSLTTTARGDEITTQFKVASRDVAPPPVMNQDPISPFDELPDMSSTNTAREDETTGQFMTEKAHPADSLENSEEDLVLSSPGMRSTSTSAPHSISSANDELESAESLDLESHDVVLLESDSHDATDLSEELEEFEDVGSGELELLPDALNDIAPLGTPRSSVPPPIPNASRSSMPPKPSDDTSD